MNMTLQVKLLSNYHIEEYTTGPNDAGNLINVPLLGSGPVFISAGMEYLVVAGHYGQAGIDDYPRIACSGPGIAVMFWDFMMFLTYIVC